MRIKQDDNTIKIWASARDTSAWATKPGKAWPCSQLSGNRVFIEIDKAGDILDFTLNGKPADVDCIERNAFFDDILLNAADNKKLTWF